MKPFFWCFIPLLARLYPIISGRDAPFWLICLHNWFLASYPAQTAYVWRNSPKFESFADGIKKYYGTTSIDSDLLIRTDYRPKSCSELQTTMNLDDSSSDLESNASDLTLRAGTIETRGSLEN